MKTKSVTDLIQIDPSLTTPVYKQIVQSISRNIDNGVLVKDDMLPSVNQISAEFSLARGSVFTAYNELRSSGIIDSIPGKGYFVLSTETRQKKKIFLLFSTFTTYKEILYNALLQHLPETCSLDIYFHHHSIRMFENLIREQSAYYNTYVIMPEVSENTSAILSKLDHKHTFLLDVGLKEYREEYPGVYQNFEKDIYSILLDSDKLVDIIQCARQGEWLLGKDIGVISYNETPLKSVIGNGITTITTDFTAMGRAMAEMVVSGKREVVENPFVIIDRKSF